MKIRSFLSNLMAKWQAPAVAETAPAEPPAPAAWTPRSARRDGRPPAPQHRHPAPPPAARTEPAAPAPSARPKTAASKSRPPVAPIGARGETDLEPSRINLENMTYPSAAGSGDDVDRAAIRELFSDIATGQAAPIRTFIGDLRATNATAEWIEICRPVMAVLLESATSLGLNDAVAPMNQFLGALDLAAEGQEGAEGPIDGAARDLLLEAYDTLAKVLPEAFGSGGAVSRRDTMLLHALLKQVPGVGLVTLDELYSAGLTSVEALSQARPGELSAATAIAMPLCEAICNALHEYMVEVDRIARLPEAQRYAGHLTELLDALARQHELYELVEAEVGFDDTRAERKRAARRKRNLCALKIEAALIEMGEDDSADTLRVLSFDRRIEHMEKFLGVRVAKRAAEQR